MAVFPDNLSAADRRSLSRLRGDVVAWAGANGRSFRWRRDGAGEYEKIVVEVLLQRTTAAAVAAVFDDFLDRFDSWKSLAAADTRQLEEALKPLGLWRRRAVSLAGLARYAVENAGRFPVDPDEHAHIPGVGQYVSNAILMFQHGAARPLLDANMARVLERVLRPRRLADIRHDPWLQRAARYLVKSPSPETVNWAVLDFAALTCRARTPRCHACVAASYCRYARRLATGQPR